MESSLLVLKVLTVAFLTVHIVAIVIMATISKIESSRARRKILATTDCKRTNANDLR